MGTKFQTRNHGQILQGTRFSDLSEEYKGLSNWVFDERLNHFDERLGVAVSKLVTISEMQASNASISRTQREIGETSEDTTSLLVVLAGSAQFEQRGRDVQLSDGNIVCWSGNDPISAKLSEGFHQLTLSLKNKHLKMYMGENADPYARPLDKSNPLSKLIYQTALEIRAAQNNQYRKTIAPMVYSAIELTSAALIQDDKERSPRNRNSINCILEYIDKNLQEQTLCPSRIADKMGMSVSNLHRIFAKENMGVSRYIMNSRLDACKRVLAKDNGTTSLTELAHEWGFSDSAHFSRSFKARFGVTPTAFRNG